MGLPGVSSARPGGVGDEITREEREVLSRVPYFPFYPADFEGDDKVEAMTTEEVGAYTLLLCKAWFQKPPGTLPRDDALLARWARVNPRKWLKMKGRVMAPFHTGTNGKFHQKRMKKEWKKIQEISRKQSQIARKRWGRKE